MDRSEKFTKACYLVCLFHSWNGVCYGNCAFCTLCRYANVAKLIEIADMLNVSDPILLRCYFCNLLGLVYF
jgi:hypothetical protein